MTPSFLLEVFPFVSIQCDKDKDQDREAPERWTSVADKRQRDSDDRHKTKRHAHIDEKVHEYTAGDAISVDSCKGLPAPFGTPYYPPDKEYI